MGVITVPLARIVLILITPLDLTVHWFIYTGLGCQQHWARSAAYIRALVNRFYNIPYSTGFVNVLPTEHI